MRNQEKNCMFLWKSNISGLKLNTTWRNDAYIECFFGGILFKQNNLRNIQQFKIYQQKYTQKIHIVKLLPVQKKSSKLYGEGEV